MRRMLTLLTVVTLLVSVWTTPLLAATARHSGRVVAVDPATRTLVVEEFAAAGQVRRLTVRLPPEARVVLSTRLPDAEITDLRYPFKDTPIQLSEIRPGDFVTVELEGDKAQATSVTVTYRR